MIRMKLGWVVAGAVVLVGCKAADATSSDAGTTTNGDAGVVTDAPLSPVDTVTTTPDPGTIALDGIVLPSGDHGAATNDTAQVTSAPNCRLAFACQDKCKTDQACKDACVKTSPDAVKTALDAVSSCLKTCGTPDHGCLINSCFDAFDACYFAGKSGTEHCSSTYECVKACPKGDDGCIDGCVQKSLPGVHKFYATYVLCVEDAKAEKCANRTPTDCQNQADSIWCGAQFQKCLGDKN